MKRKLTENLKRIEDRIQEACARAGRNRRSVHLLAVTKSVSVDVIRTLIEIGVGDLAENRVQELTRRAAMLEEWAERRQFTLGSQIEFRPRWHMIGHLQRNKVKAVLPWLTMIHSVDSLRLAEEISAQSVKLGKVIPVLIEVNAGGEESKYGVAVAAATHLIAEIRTLPGIEVRGLMTMAPFTDDAGTLRFVFQRTRDLFDEIVGERICGQGFNLLSMGMSNDFEYAIEAGATHLRIGSALFEGLQLPACAASTSDHDDSV